MTMADFQHQQDDGHKHGDGHDHDHHEHDQHPQDHDEHEHDHQHAPGAGPIGWLLTILHLDGGHSHADEILIADPAFEGSREGIRTIWIALALLLGTFVIQAIIYFMSGSVALFADSIHNIGDGLNTIPLLIAFYLSRKAANRRYTYGYHRAEDVAGVIIVLSIAVSAGLIFYESIRKFVEPEPLSNLGWVIAAAIIGFIGNEAVAVLQIRTGKRIGSAALVTDGQHARTDGLTSLAVLVAAVATWLGYPIVDPIIGILIGIVILFITRDAVVSIWYRLMDAIEPEVLERFEKSVYAKVDELDGLKEICRVRMRWMGHRLHSDLFIAVDPTMTTVESHDLTEQIRHDLFHELPLLSECVVHIEPWSEDMEAQHTRTSKHEPIPRPMSD